MTILRADGSVLERECPLIADEAERPDRPHAISLSRWLADQAAGVPHALVIPNDADVQTLNLPWGELAEIWLEFPSFVEGQAYSQARLLRTRFSFGGLLLARGDVLLDQLYYMQRCGFDAFDLREDQDTDACAKALSQFSAAYVSGSNRSDGILALRTA